MNVRYPNLSKKYFIAGDEEQFLDRIGYYSITKNPTLSRDSHILWDGFKYVTHREIVSTFRYIFDKFKKGIFVRIRDNTLDLFLPFSKHNYTNEWSHLIDAHDRDIFAKVCTDFGWKFNPKSVNYDKRFWYTNNGLMRYESPISESDTDLDNFFDMLTELCRSKTVPDIDFFINRRDFPILKKNYTEPYNNIWNGNNQPLVSHKYEKYYPIFSSSVTDDFADMLIPPAEDWARVMFKDGKVYDKYDRDFNDEFPTKWEDKKDIAVFRGSSTGIGVDISTNQRLKVAQIGMKNKSYIDAGITKWSNRLRKIQGSDKLQTFNPQHLPPLVQPLTPEQQSKYKYIIHIQGYVSAYRLSLELSMKSVILFVKTPYKLWFENRLVPYVHYVPVKADMSDLIDTIKWCRDNDDKCKQIAENAYKFYHDNLDKNGILTYISDTLTHISRYIPLYSITYRHKLDIPVTKYTVDIKKTIFENKNTQIQVGLFRDLECVVKSSKNDLDIEAFIGIKCLNPLRKIIPNFVYTYGYRDNTVITEYVKGIPFNQWLANNYKYDDFIFILYQIYLSLLVAQRNCLFTHYDLFPWNIILVTSEKKTIDYPIGPNNIMSVTTSLIPVIIDFDKSRACYDRHHYGKRHVRYNFNKNHDMWTLIMSCLKILRGKVQLSLFSDLFPVKDVDIFNYSYTYSNSIDRDIKIKYEILFKKYISKREYIPHNNIKYALCRKPFRNVIYKAYFNCLNGKYDEPLKIQLPIINEEHYTYYTDEVFHTHRDNFIDPIIIEIYDMLEYLCNYSPHDWYTPYKVFLKMDILKLKNNSML